MSHYYDASPTTPTDPFTFEVTCFDTRFTFHSDRGVFKKDGLDFASRLLIEHVSVEPASECLDLGSGSGVIGLILTRQYNLHMTAVDINARAVALTEKNAQQLHVPVTAVQSDGFNEIQEQFFDHIFTNPPIRIGKQAMYALLSDALAHLKVDGSLWVVMHKKHGVESFQRSFAKDADIKEVIRKKGFRLLRLKRSR